MAATCSARCLHPVTTCKLALSQKAVGCWQSGAAPWQHIETAVLRLAGLADKLFGGIQGISLKLWSPKQLLVPSWDQQSCSVWFFIGTKQRRAASAVILWGVLIFSAALPSAQASPLPHQQPPQAVMLLLWLQPCANAAAPERARLCCCRHRGLWRVTAASGALKGCLVVLFWDLAE